MPTCRQAHLTTMTMLAAAAAATYLSQGMHAAGSSFGGGGIRAGSEKAQQGWEGTPLAGCCLVVAVQGHPIVQSHSSCLGLAHVVVQVGYQQVNTSLKGTDAHTSLQP